MSSKVENEMSCFSLYACGKEVVRRHKDFLDPLDLTYTQYITMAVLWDRREITVKELGERLQLDSGTLTPLLKRLETKGYITRRRSSDDERNLIVECTDAGMELRSKTSDIPEKIKCQFGLSSEECDQLGQLLGKLHNNIRKRN